MIELVFPSDATRCSARIGMIAIVLGVFVAVFFPVSIAAGTETDGTRWATVIALVVAGGMLKWGAPRKELRIAALVLLAAAGGLVPAPWIAWFAMGCAGYLALTLFPRIGGLKSREIAHSPSLPAAEVVRENVEAIAMALVLALTVRQFAIEAFVIPTGSMYPTILGQHNEGGRQLPGDRLLASKLPVMTGNLTRWSIIVFHYPLFRPTNYIKRLVGLPGEFVEIIDGDIWVNRELAAKPDVVQESLWFREYPAESMEGDGRPSIDFEADAVGTWTFEDPVASVAVDSGKETWLGYDGALHESFDRRIAFDVSVDSLEQDGAVFARLHSRDRTVELEITAAGAFLTAPGIERQEVELPGIGPGQSRRYALGVADRVVRVYVDGHQTVRIAHADTGNRAGEDRGASVGARGAQVRFSDLTIDHDLHYVTKGKSQWDIPEKCYVTLGDNTHHSEDSRLWRGKVITHKDGREFVAAQSARIDEETKRTNFRRADGKVSFYDKYGVFREFPDEDVEVSDERLPFVHEDDLIGRAFFIFFPFPPFGSFRPRFLP